MKRKGKHFWVFKIEAPVTIKSTIKGAHFDNNWMILEQDGNITVKASSDRPFCWDGATPKINLLDMIFGTPDGVVDARTGKAKTYYATLLHDALYQFAPRKEVTRKQADMVMLDEMRKTKFRPRILYYFVIRVLGWIWWYKKRRYIW